MRRSFSFLGDRPFFIIVAILVVGGVLMFSSASLGLLAREGGAEPWRLATTQLLLGLIPGTLALLTLRFTPLRLIERLTPFAYVAALAFTALVFVPQVGRTFNGATRWIDIGFTTIQPSEFLKIAVVLMLAFWLSKARNKLRDVRTGLIPFCLIIGIPCLLLLLQPNTSGVLVIGVAAVALYILAGAPWRDIFILGVVGIVLLGLIVLIRPYVLERIQTFINPSRDPLSSGYQIQQSLIAIGSGGIFGRGFGQSVQKFSYLPEAHGDSVFAVYAEEFGFVGALILVFLFAAFAVRGFSIASDAATLYAALAATGLTLIIVISAFMNIGAMLSILPLTGIPLPFVSHGGTALLCALASVGLILNVAAHPKKGA